MKRHIETRKRAKRLRADLTAPERKLWNAIRANRIGVKFQRQVVLAPYIADFAARSERLVVEVDGDTHAGREAADAVRTKALAARGYRVLRFSNFDVMGNLDGVLRAILIELGHDPESPLTPMGERESREAAGSGGVDDPGWGSTDPLSPALPP
jgi:very-short-patch-repair endonuclease